MGDVVMGLRASASAEGGGQVVKAGPAVERTLVGSMAEMMKESKQPPPRDAPEKVDWVAFLGAQLQPPEDESPLIAIGLARGYQIWALLGNGDCEELVSDRQGPAKILKLLPNPPLSGDVKDKLKDQRPLVALVDSISAVAGRLHSTLSIVSLATGQPVHSFKFDDPISSIRVSEKYIVVIFPGKFYVCDAVNFAELFWIQGCYRPEDGSGTPLDLGSSWIAFADYKLSGPLQSIGGVHSSDNIPAYATHVINAAKNLRQTVSSISESLGRKGQGPSSPAFLTLIHPAKWTKTQTEIHNLPRAADPASVLFHFPALKDEPLGWIRLNARSDLVVVGGLSGQFLNLFSLLPHPSGSAFAAAAHLYTLFRGTTPATVLHAAFSPDSRWVAASTNHGTTHVFPVSPYGGPVSVRTHGGPGLVNRESRFHRSAGIDPRGPASESPPPAASPLSAAVKAHHSSSPSLSPAGSARGSPLGRDAHPLLKSAHSALWKVAGNPRAAAPALPPTVVQAAAKIHQQLLPGGVGSWAGDLSDGLSAKRRTSEPPPVLASAAFGTPRAAAAPAQTSLFLVGDAGELWEYGLGVKAQVPSGKIETPDSPIALTLLPAATWTLHRTKSSADVRAPLSRDNLLRKAAVQAQTVPLNNASNTDWISQVEMGTYASPTRRLWMGPQITFRTFVESAPQSQSLNSALAPDASPQPPSRSGSGKQRKGKKGKAVAKEDAPPQTTTVERSAPMKIQASGGRTDGRTVPVVLEAVSGSYEPGLGVTTEVCGSWTDSDHIGATEAEGRLRQSIADAMKAAPIKQSLRGRGSSCGDSDMEDARDSFSDTDSALLHSLDP